LVSLKKLVQSTKKHSTTTTRMGLPSGASLLEKTTERWARELGGLLQLKVEIDLAVACK
jgi:hypothetical protein